MTDFTTQANFMYTDNLHLYTFCKHLQKIFFTENHPHFSFHFKHDTLFYATKKSVLMSNLKLKDS